MTQMQKLAYYYISFFFFVLGVGGVVVVGVVLVFGLGVVFVCFCVCVLLVCVGKNQELGFGSVLVSHAFAWLSNKEKIRFSFNEIGKQGKSTRKESSTW